MDDEDGPLGADDLGARRHRAGLGLVDLEHRACSHDRIIPAVSGARVRAAQSHGGGWNTQPAADHRRDDLDRVELVRRAGEGVAGEHDEIREVAGEELAAAALVAREPGGRHGRGDERLLDRERLVGAPAGAVVDRPEDAGADPGEGVELLDRRVRAVRDDGAGVEQAAERVGARRAGRPRTARPGHGRTGHGRTGRSRRRRSPRTAGCRQGRGIARARCAGAARAASRRPASPRRHRGRRGWPDRRSRARRPASRPPRRAGRRPRAPRGS